MEDWVIEELKPFYRSGIRVRRKLYEKRSAYQLIQIFEAEEFGKMLVLDGAVQTTQKDEAYYHELLVKLPLLFKEKISRALVIGGGDGGALAAMLAEGVEEAWLCELDREVIEACSRFLPELSRGAFEHPRVHVVVEDGFTFLAKKPGYFDAIFVDSPDPVGEARRLYTPEFYRRLKQALRPHGIVSCQSGSPWLQPELARAVYTGLHAEFAHVRPYWGFVPSYPGTAWLFTFASDEIDPPQHGLKKADFSGCQYLTEETVRASFMLPRWLQDVVEKGEWKAAF